MHVCMYVRKYVNRSVVMNSSRTNGSRPKGLK